MRLKELADFQFQYTILERTKMTKKALCDLVVPFRDKYALTDGQALQIVRGELPLIKIEKLMKNAEFYDDVISKEWIPVTERLPEHGVIVLCRLIFNELRILQWDSVSKWWLGYGAGDDWRQKDVTHWMPLPSTEGLK